MFRYVKKEPVFGVTASPPHTYTTHTTLTIRIILNKQTFAKNYKFASVCPREYKKKNISCK